MLQEMEAALLTDDPRLFSALSGEAKPIGRRQVLIGLGLIVGGIATLFAGLIAKSTPIGVLGFLIALTGVLAILTSFGGRSAKSKGARRANGLGSRLEQRWEERKNQ